MNRRTSETIKTESAFIKEEVNTTIKQKRIPMADTTPITSRNNLEENNDDDSMNTSEDDVEITY